MVPVIHALWSDAKENRFCYIARLTIPSQWVESIEGWQNLRDLFLERNVE